MLAAAFLCPAVSAQDTPRTEYEKVFNNYRLRRHMHFDSAQGFSYESAARTAALIQADNKNPLAQSMSVNSLKQLLILDSAPEYILREIEQSCKTAESGKVLSALQEVAAGREIPEALFAK